MSTMIRATRKGGAVAHLMRTADAPSVCGRVMVLIPGGEGLRLCRTCARITGVQMDIDTREFPGLPVVSDWTDIEQTFIKGANDSFSLGMCREVLAQYESNPGEYDTPRMLRHVAMMYAALRLHTGRDYRDPVDSVAPSLNRRGGDGMVNKNSRSTARQIGATANQRSALCRMAAFADSLFSQLLAAQGKEDTKPNAMVERYSDEFFNGLTTRAAIDKEFTSTSALIDRLKLELSKAKQEARKNAPAEKTAAEDGYYVHGDTFVCVKWNRAHTGQYATVWDGASWEYDGRESRKLVADVKAGKLSPMTPEDAKRFGDLYGSCFKCSRTLTDPESIAQGYGPVCAGRMGW
jgi:hypothetical protein